MTFLESNAFECDPFSHSYVQNNWVPAIQAPSENRKRSWVRPSSPSIRIDLASDRFESVSADVKADVAVLHSVEADNRQSEFQLEKLKLFAVLGRFHDEGYSTARDRESKISKQSLEAAVKFIQLLPPNVVLPQVLPDGEEGVILAWSSPQKKTFLTIDNWWLHGVTNPGSPDAIYFDDVEFRGNRVPLEILAAVDAT